MKRVEGESVHLSNNFKSNSNPTFVPIEPTKIQNVVIEPRPCFLGDAILNSLTKLHNFQVEDDDVWVMTYPKSGTTWVQELCWLVINNYNFDKAKSVDIGKRSPFLELSYLYPHISLNTFEMSEHLPRPRLIKSHLPIAALPKELWTKNPKIVYVCRDPRDAAASLYHHRTGWLAMKSEKSSFFKTFIDGKTIYGPYWDHVLEFWQISHLPNVLFLTFEEMKADLEGVVRRVCKFLDKPITDEQLRQIVDHLSFESMQKNEACQHHLERKSIHGDKVNSNRFIRKGEVGGYKDDIPQGFINDFNKWIESNLQNSDFPYYKMLN